MTNAQKEALAQEALEMYQYGISVHFRKKDAAMMLGAVVVANFTTLFLAGAISKLIEKQKRDRTQ